MVAYPPAHVVVVAVVCRYDSVLYIGAPLVQKQRELIACLCEDVHVAYQVMPIAPVVGPNEA